MKSHGGHEFTKSDMGDKTGWGGDWGATAVRYRTGQAANSRSAHSATEARRSSQVRPAFGSCATESTSMTGENHTGRTAARVASRGAFAGALRAAGAADDEPIDGAATDRTEYACGYRVETPMTSVEFSRTGKNRVRAAATRGTPELGADSISGETRSESHE